MENVLKARITADISDYKAKMGGAQVITEDFEKGVEKTVKAVSELDKILAVLIREIASLNTENSKSKVQIQNLTDQLNKEKLAIAAVTAELNKLKNAPSTPPKALGILEQLNQKAAQLRRSISEGTNLLSIARLNKELEVTQVKISRIQALGRSAGSAAGQVGKLTNSVGSANSVAIEFNRVIQDAPFGLIGIGNNLQQLAGNFANVSASAKAAGGNVGTALKQSFAALISPVNLSLLAISALTAGFTAYQMGAFDGLFATKDFREELDKFRETLSNVDSVRIDSLKSADDEIVKINSLKSIIEDETTSRELRNKAVDTLQKQYPSYFGNLDREKILAGEVGKAYEEITKQLVARAEVESSVKRIADLNDQERIILEKNKDSLEDIAEVRQRIAELQDKANKQQQILLESNDASEKDLALRRKLNAENTIRFLVGENEAVGQLLKVEEDRNKLKEIANNALKITLSETEKVKESNVSLTEVLTDQEETLGLISSLTAQIKFLNDQKDLSKSQEEINLLTGKIQLLKEELNLINAIAERANTPIDTPVPSLPARDGSTDIYSSSGVGAPSIVLPSIDTDELEEEAEKVKATNDIIAASFAGLSSQISSSLGISNDALRGFVQTVISNAPKVIQAIIAQTAAKKAAAKADQVANIQTATGNSIVSATEAAKGLGPIGLAALPILIGGALALISGAFKKGAGSSANTGSSQTFSNVGGRREFGGSVISGKPYIVGEKRPELFVPSSNGIIIPSIPTMGSNGIGSNGAATGRMIVEVEGVIANDVIRIQNKKSINKVNRA